MSKLTDLLEKQGNAKEFILTPAQWAELRKEITGVGLTFTDARQYIAPDQATGYVGMLFGIGVYVREDPLVQLVKDYYDG